MIDQTAGDFTFYSIGMDPSGGGPLVIRGVFTPPSIAPPAKPYGNGSEIGSAGIKSAAAYSLSFNNGLTFTNMTPQVSASQSVVSQMAAWTQPSTRPAQKRPERMELQPGGHVRRCFLLHLLFGWWG